MKLQTERIKKNYKDRCLHDNLYYERDERGGYPPSIFMNRLYMNSNTKYNMITSSVLRYLTKPIYKEKQKIEFVVYDYHFQKKFINYEFY